MIGAVRLRRTRVAELVESRDTGRIRVGGGGASKTKALPGRSVHTGLIGQIVREGELWSGSREPRRLCIRRARGAGAAVVKEAAAGLREFLLRPDIAVADPEVQRRQDVD